MNEAMAPHTLIAEARELLAEMEAGLLRLERDPGDAEGIHAAFRAMHTIKGSAGIFGFDAVSAFAHVVEGTMEDVRAGRAPVTPDLVALLLRCADHVQHLVGCLGEPDAQARLAQCAPAGAALAAQLEALDPSRDAAVPDAPAANPCWHLSLRFGPDVLRHGMDPLSMLRYLGTLGRVQAVETVDLLPATESMDPEACHLGFEVRYACDAPREAIESAFEFVRDDGCITVLEPGALLSRYADLMERSGDAAGELLLRCGALTARELAQARALRDARRTAAPAAAWAGGEAPPAAATPRSEARFVRVQADKLDELIDLVGELVIASAGVNTIARRARLAEIQEPAGMLERLVEDVRGRALKLRMVPIGDTFARFDRVVHDLGRELGKSVELAVDGGDTELDKAMVDKLADPLLHLVRNALDHGIEPPQVRRERGKPPVARLQLHARHDSGSIVIEVEDDGAGLDRAAIAARAVERGLLEEGTTPDDDALLRLITEPGFSTAAEVTSISGRGVGMDVVRRNVEALRGAVAIDSSPGEGTRVMLRLPLTLAIIDGFVVGVGGSTFVLPLETVVECIELTAHEGQRLRESGYTSLRGELLPLLRLRDVFGSQGTTGRRENIVIVQQAGRRAGFVVDTLQGEFQTVIKPLGKLFERLAGISGATIFGTGEVALILDVPALLQRAQAGATAARHAVTPSLSASASLS